MTDAKKPMAEANRISSMLNTVLGANRFPVKVDELALEYSRQCFSDSPIDKVQGEDLDGFDGLLKANKSRVASASRLRMSSVTTSFTVTSRTFSSAATATSKRETTTSVTSRQRRTCLLRPC